MTPKCSANMDIYYYRKVCSSGANDELNHPWFQSLGLKTLCYLILKESKCEVKNCS